MAKRSMLGDPQRFRAVYKKAAELCAYTKRELRRQGIGERTIAEIVDNTDWVKEAQDLV
jgi:L-amino acid N-acyltransferase YncA